MTTFGLIGAAGFVAPRHMKAIQHVGGDLLVACDLHDSVGILDSHFPKAEFSQSPPSFFNRCAELGVDYITVCTPNHRHVDHVLAAFGAGCDVICEKPLALSKAELLALRAMEQATGKRVYTVLQLRELAQVKMLRQRVIEAALAVQPDPARTLVPYSDSLPSYAVRVEYVSRRGAWYHASWKGDEARSGGVTANIGAHLFDLLTWLFGKVEDVAVIERSLARVRGRVVLTHAVVEFLLSVDAADLPPDEADAHRVVTVNGEALDLTRDVRAFQHEFVPEVFKQQHNAVYEAVLAGRGWGIEDVRPGIDLTYRIRTASCTHQSGSTA